MWEKNYRQAVFTGIYQIIFWREQGISMDIDLEYILEQINSKNIVTNKTELNFALDIFLQNESEYNIILEKYLKKRDKTFLLVLAILYTYMVETQHKIYTESEKTKIVSHYIRLTENLIGGQNVNLVHAILIKLSSKI